MTSFTFGLPLVPGEGDTAIFCEIARRDELTTPAERDALLAEMVPVFLEAIHTPEAEIATIELTVGGYEDDPRDLWMISEVVHFLREFAIQTGLRDWTTPEFGRLSNLSKSVLIMVGAVAKGHGIQIVRM